MFGTLGVPEMIIIFVLALVLFGPKKLPEIGRTIGKAITEFRRASSELKETFNKEMQQLEQETAPIKEAAQQAAQDVTSQYQYDSYNYDYSSYSYDEASQYGTESNAATEPSPESASATQGAESMPSDAQEFSEESAAYEQTASSEPGTSPEYEAEPGVQSDPPVSAEHKA